MTISHLQNGFHLAHRPLFFMVYVKCFSFLLRLAPIYSGFTCYKLKLLHYNYYL